MLNNLDDLLIAIYCFVDDAIKAIGKSLFPILEKPSQKNPPSKKAKLSLSEITTLAIFRYFTDHRTWKSFYRFASSHLRNYFPNLPTYKSFLESTKRTANLGLMLLQAFMRVFRRDANLRGIKFVDSSPLPVCKIKREFTHRVCKGIAAKSKSTTGWFYGFKLHAICDEVMRLLAIKITPGNTDDRAGLRVMWSKIIGLIVADAGYVSKELIGEGRSLGKQVMTAVRGNMKKLMTKAQHYLLKQRQRIETVFAVLKERMGIVIAFNP